PILRIELYGGGPDRVGGAGVHGARTRDREGEQIAVPVLEGVRSQELRLVDDGCGVQAGRVDGGRGDRLGCRQYLGDDDLQIVGHLLGAVRGEIAVGARASGAAGDRHRLEGRCRGRIDGRIHTGAYADDVSLDAARREVLKYVDDIEKCLVVGVG